MDTHFPFFMFTGRVSVITCVVTLLGSCPLMYVIFALPASAYIGSVLFRASAFTGAKISKRSTSGYRMFRALVEYSSDHLN